MIEAGVPDHEIVSWFGLTAPSGTPAPVVARMNAIMRAERARDGEIIRASGARVDRYAAHDGLAFVRLCRRAAVPDAVP